MEPSEKPKAQEFIFRPYITLRNGRRLYAYQVGLKAFKIPVKGGDQGGKK